MDTSFVVLMSRIGDLSWEINLEFLSSFDHRQH